ncbi:MAG: amidohydrolase [Chloroflexaceae bacterium]|jgi:5-methylthioadenosine/S-adenosylhomocysteine deaminase|nr:amidohydrolase [Chloroflexaceae bacterium]
MYDLLIQNPAVLQFDGAVATVLPTHSIAVSNGRIAAIAPNISAGQAREVLDASGMLAVPGFVNCHAHVPMGLFRGVAEDVLIERWFNDYIWPMESNLTEEDVYWGALLGLAEMIEAGVTTVADHYFAMDEVARAVEQAGTRALLAWAVFGGDGAQERLQDTVAFVERWQDAANGRIRAWLGPHSPYTCEPEFLKQVARQAQALGVGLHIHLSETAEQVRQSLAQHGKTPVAVAHEAGLFAVPTLAAHVAHPEQNDLELLRAGGVAVGSCPKTSMKLGTGVAPVPAMRQVGITVGLGSDGAASNNSYDMLEAARMMALVQKHMAGDPRVLPVSEALALATREGAKALGLGGVTGELREGFQADIVLFRLDAPHLTPQHNLAASLLYSARANDVDTVLVDGRVLMRNRQLLTIDKAQVLREVSERMERLVQRLPNRRIQTYPT